MPLVFPGTSRLARTFPSLVALLFLGACGGGGGGSTPTPPAPVVAVTLTAPANPLTVETTLPLQVQVTGTTDTRVTWQVAEGASGGAISPAGLYQAPALPGTFTLIAQSVADPSKRASAPVRVVARPTIVQFAATPTGVTAGQATTLVWATTGATTIKLDGQATGGDHLTVTPSTDHDYVLEATNEAGTTVQASAQVAVVLPPLIRAFTCDASSLTSGASTTLRWQVEGAQELLVDGQAVTGTSVLCTPSITGDHVLEARNSLGYAVQATVRISVVPAATISAFAPARTAITAGEATQLSWITSGASELRIDGTPVSGTSLSVSPSATHTYTLEARNSLGATTTANATVTVVPLPAINTFSPARAAITAGESTQLAWTTSGAAELRIDGTLVSGTSLSVSPGATHTYTLEARNSLGATTTATAAITVVAPPAIGSFTTDASSLTAGQATTLRWTVSGATTLLLDGATVTGTSASVSPSATGDHVLEARNSLGYAVQATVRISVVPAPTISAFAPARTAITAGEATQLAWTTSGAAELRIDGTLVSGTSLSVSPGATHTYTLEARNSLGATTTATAAITVVAPPAIGSFTTDASSLTAGQATTLRWTVSGATTLLLDGATVTGTSASVSPSATGDHVLEARNSLGYAVQATVRISVVPAPTISAFAPARTAITAGEATQLAWTTSGASELRIDGTLVSGTSLSVSPSATHTYTLEARNSLGDAITASTTVTVVPAPTLSFSASASGFLVGGSSTLSWSATGAATLTLDGVAVTGSSTTVTPYRTTTYTLRAANSLGFEVVRTATVSVTPYPGQIWFADGQVWLTWTDALPLSGTQTYDVYRAEAPIASLASATLVGRLLPEDITASRLKLADAAATWVLPAAGGGTHTLAANEAHFTYTPHAAATAFYAVVPHGGSLDTNLRFGPVDESVSPVSAHPQRSGTDGTSGRAYTDYALWLDGRAGADAGRGDFPVMGPPSFNGMAALFRVYQSPTSATPMPAVLMMHGNGGNWLNRKPVASDDGVDLALDPGLLVTLDDAHAYINGGGVTIDSTRWFGSWDGYDRFAGSLSLPPNGAVVHPYTLRRSAWIRDWLVRDLGVDPNRVVAAGHSMGALGASTLARYAPDKFSACLGLLFHTTIPDGTIGDYLRGTSAQNLSTSLGVTMQQAHDPTVALGSGASPLCHYLWGVADGVIPWTDKPAKIDAFDAARAGVRIWWDGRLHNDPWTGHFVGSVGLRAGTLLQVRRDRSFPAFSHEIGSDTDTAQGWGTRGGYLEWDPATLSESSSTWSVELWLRSTATLAADVPGFASVTADVSLRRPQAFLPAAGSSLNWSLTRVSDGALLQSGSLTLGGDGLVTVTGLAIPKTRVRLVISR